MSDSPISLSVKETDMTVILVSHSMEDIATIADKLLVMNHGEIMLYGTPAEVFSKYDTLLSAGLDLPQITHIINTLKTHGFDLPDGIFTIEQAVEAITRLGGVKND